MTDLSQYKQLYIKTAFEYVKALQDNLAAYTTTPSSEKIEILHRSAHSLKSQSLVMGYESTGLLCKEIEFIFRKVKDSELILSEQLIHALAETFQKIYDSLESIKTSEIERNLTSETEELQKISGVKFN